MDEKSGYALPGPSPGHNLGRRPRRFPTACIAVWGLLVLYGIWALARPHQTSQASQPAAKLSTLKSKVPLEVHIMSKCPDARDCLRDLVVPAMEDIADKVDFRLSYIGQPIGDHGAECKHGPTECLGNIVELCAAELYPDPKVHLGFTMCLTNDYQHIPEQDFVKQCALEHGIEFDRLNDCASRDDGQYGFDLLRASFSRSRNADVTKSCTVRLDNEIRCVRDGGQWYDCKGGSKPQDLVRDVADATT